MSSFSRSTAAQFFLEEDNPAEGADQDLEETSKADDDSEAMEVTSDHPEESSANLTEESKVVDYLSEATATSSAKDKIGYLEKVSDIITERQPSLLDNFLDEMLNFQSDTDISIRSYILKFIEKACVVDPETIPKVLNNMRLMLQDKKVCVQKNAIRVLSKLYKLTLMWLSKSKFVTEEMENAWTSVNDLKKCIIKLLDSDMDGIRTHSVKFIETVILLQTPRESDSVFRENDFCLENVPITIKCARPRKLEEDARSLLEELLKFHGSRHATSVNLMTCMGSIVLIAKLRPQFFGKVVTAIEKLNAILPPTLEKSQVTSVRKHMKLQLIGLMKHPRAIEFYDSISTLLTDLGATSQELHKSIPHYDEIRAERRKRQKLKLDRDDGNHGNRSKKPRLVYEERVSTPLVDDEDDEDLEKEPDPTPSKEAPMNDLEKLIFETLDAKLAAEMVIAFMGRLPEKIPAHFMASHTPIAIAGTESQVKHVSRLLAAQITAAQAGPEAAFKSAESAVSQDELENAEIKQIPSLVSSIPLTAKENKPTGLASNTTELLPIVKKKIAKPVKLTEITKPMSKSEKQKHTFGAVRRILQSGERLSDIKLHLVSSIAIGATFELRYFIMSYIKEDIKCRLDLGMCWLMAEYCLCQDFLSKSVPIYQDSPFERYEWTFYNLMKSILENSPDVDKSHLAIKIFTDAPIIPDKGIELLKALCSQPSNSSKGMKLLMELASKRPRKLTYLSALLEFSSHANEEIRGSSVSCVLQLYQKAGNMKPLIEDKAVQTFLNSLRYAHPPEILFTEEQGRADKQDEWSEEAVKACLSLYLELLVVKNSLIHELAKVYVETTADVKRGILRYIEPPVRKMGMDSPDLMALLDTFPKGSETLITRIIHILTDRTLPSAELVTRVRNLYAKRVSDVRFLIPVLSGLNKTEILSALPKLIKLNPHVVKEVFNRLLGIHADTRDQHTSPITPVDLMVALHKIEPTKCDVKTVIKATSLCFNESEVYTPEVLAVVINQLLELVPLPTLLMRTVIQTLALHSKLSGFIMNTLSRLVNKQVWKQAKVWEGFIKCCQRTIPKSIPILLTLPPPQLKLALETAPDLKNPLISHLMSYTPQQRSCMPPALLSTVLGDVKPEFLVKAEQQAPPGYYEHNHEANEAMAQNEDGMEMQVKLEPVDYNDPNM